MNPRWKIRRERHSIVSRWWVWRIYFDGKANASYFAWRDAVAHIDRAARKFGV